MLFGYNLVLDMALLKNNIIVHFFTMLYNITSSDTWDVGLEAAIIKRVRNSSPY
jgi:hypothetical protein